MFNFLTYILTLLDNKNITLYELIIKFFLEITNITFKSTNAELLQVKLQWFIDSLAAQQSNTGHILLDNLLLELAKYPQKKVIIEILINIIEEKTIEGYTLPFTAKEEIISYSEKTYGYLFVILVHILTNNLALNTAEIIKLGSLYGLCETINLSTIFNQNNKYYFCYSLAEMEINFNKTTLHNMEQITNYISLQAKELKKSYSKERKLKIWQKLILYSVDHYLNLFQLKSFTYHNIYSKYFYARCYLIYIFN